MKACVLRKVPYRFGGTSRVLWAFILAQREGLSLLFVEKPDDNYSHALAIAAEDPESGVFEDTTMNSFPMENADMEDIGVRLEALSEGLAKENFRKLFRIDD